MRVPYKVLLPNRIFDQASDKLHLIQLILKYMQRYPHYAFLYEENGFAICERKEAENE